MTHSSEQETPGWKLVPLRMTDEMGDAFELAELDPEAVGHGAFYQPGWDAALAAAPTPPASPLPDPDLERLEALLEPTDADFERAASYHASRIFGRGKAAELDALRVNYAKGELDALVFLFMKHRIDAVRAYLLEKGRP